MPQALGNVLAYHWFTTVSGRFTLAIQIGGDDFDQSEIDRLVDELAHPVKRPAPKPVVTVMAAAAAARPTPTPQAPPAKA